MKRKTFICKTCKQEFDTKTFSAVAVTMKQCPQCYSKEVLNRISEPLTKETQPTKPDSM